MYSGRPASHYERLELDEMGASLVGSITKAMLGVRGSRGYLDDPNLINAFMQCAYLDPYEMQKGLRRVATWINEMVSQDYMPQVSDNATKE